MNEVVVEFDHGGRTINVTVIVYGRALIDYEVDRIGEPSALGLDGTLFCRFEASSTTVNFQGPMATRRSRSSCPRLTSQQTLPLRCPSGPGPGQATLVGSQDSLAGLNAGSDERLWFVLTRVPDHGAKVFRRG